MAQAWIVTEGQYSDARSIGVFSSFDAAVAYAHARKALTRRDVVSGATYVEDVQIIVVPLDPAISDEAGASAGLSVDPEHPRADSRGLRQYF